MLPFSRVITRADSSYQISITDTGLPLIRLREDLVGGRWPMSSQEYSSSRLSGREHTSSPAPINCRQQQQAAYQAQQRTRDNVAYNVRLLEQEEVQQQAQQQAQLRGLQQQVVYQARQQQAQREAQKQRAVYGVWLAFLQTPESKASQQASAP